MMKFGIVLSQFLQELKKKKKKKKEQWYVNLLEDCVENGLKFYRLEEIQFWNQEIYKFRYVGFLK